MSKTEESSCNGTELRAVLLGWHKSGKTSVINTILGPGVTVAASGQCVKKEGRVNGRNVTLVDTPGWWKDCSIRDSPELSKQAIMRSVSLCPPGPHAFLLVIEADIAFTEKCMLTLTQHMELLGERVWAYTIVLFTGSDKLINMTIDQRIQHKGKHLVRLLKKCGNRYHVFDIEKGSSTQVSGLFDKIEDVVRQNCGRIFETDPEVLQGLQRKWEDVQRRATVRQTKVQEERATIKEKANVHHLQELRLALLGWVISGKSSAGNIILNQKKFVTEQRTTECIRGYGNVAGRNVTVLDTPGYWKFFSPEINPICLQDAILQSMSGCKKFPHVMLLVLPADTSFMQEQKRVIKENMAILGEQIWRYTIVLFTWSDFLGDALIEHHIESEGEALQWLIEKCGNRYHVFDNRKVGDCVQVSELLEKIEEMVAGNCLFRPGVPELHEKTEVQLDSFEEDQVVGILKLLKEEWNRRTMEFRENVEKLQTDIIGPSRKSNRSLTPPPNLHETEGPSDTPKKFGPAGEMDSPLKKKRKFGHTSKVSDDLKEQLISLMEREWSRQEAIVMEKVKATLLNANQSHDVCSEVSEEDIRVSVNKVLWWFPGCKHETHQQICSK